MRRRVLLAELSLLAMTAVWGVTFPMVKEAVTGFPVMAFLAYRFAAASVLVAAVWRKQLRVLPLEGLRAGVLMGALLTGLYVFQTLGLERTSSSHAGFITGLFVVLTPLFGKLFFAEDLDRPAALAAAASLVGLLLLSSGGPPGQLWGDFLVFICACFFALHIFATDRSVERFDVGPLLVVQLTTVALLTFSVAAVQRELPLPSSQQLWVALAVTAVLASALGFFVQTYAQRHASPVRIALILTAEPVFAGIFAYVLLGESLSAVGWAGAALIMVSIVTVQVLPYVGPSKAGVAGDGAYTNVRSILPRWPRNSSSS